LPSEGLNEIYPYYHVVSGKSSISFETN